MAFSYTLNSDKTLATVAHSFRTVKIDGENKKRDSVTFNFFPITDYDSKANAVLNESLAQYGKILIAQNAEDWNYIPIETEITLDNLFSYQSAPSARGNRLINKVTLGEISESYTNWATSSGKTDKQAQTGANVIRNQFKDILGNSAALSAMMNNLSQFADSDSIAELSNESIAALTRLIENLSELTNPEITADSL